MLARNALTLFKRGSKLGLIPRVLSKCIHRDVGVIGVPFAFGQPHGGVSQSPQRIRESGIFSKLEIMGYEIHDYGDLQFEQYPHDPTSCNIKNPRAIGAATKQIGEKVRDIVKAEQTCVSLGGDHSMSIGTVAGHAEVQKDLTLFWIDAHTDINPPLSSLSGNIHGMVLSFLLHELKEYIPKVEGLEWIRPCLHAQDIAFIGVRDLDPAERYIIEKLGITAYTMHEVDRHGIDYVMEHAIDAVNPGLKRPIHLSFDIDSLDPAVSPSTGTPVPGGLTIREGMFIAEEIYNTGKLTGIDIVELNPEIGTQQDQELTLFTVGEIITACFGKRRRGNVPEGYELLKPQQLNADSA